MTFGLGDGPNGASHGFIGNSQEAVSYLINNHGLIRFTVDLVCELLQNLAASLDIERFILIFAKDLGEELGQ